MQTRFTLTIQTPEQLTAERGKTFSYITLPDKPGVLEDLVAYALACVNYRPDITLLIQDRHRGVTVLWWTRRRFCEMDTSMLKISGPEHVFGG